MKEDTYAAVEPRHINYFFYLNDYPERNIHSIKEIQDYLNQFSDWEFDEELRLDFLNYIRKTYRNALISLENFDLSNLDLDEYKDCLNVIDFNSISPDDFIREKLSYYVSIYGLSKLKVKPDIGAGEKPNKLETSKSSSDIIDRIKSEAYENERLERLKYEALGKNYDEEKTIKQLEQQKRCIEVIKNDFKNSLIKIKNLLPQIDNEIEYEKSKSSKSTNTGNDELGMLEEPESVEDDINDPSRINFKKEVTEFVNRMIETKELDLNDNDFVRKAKRKLIAELSKRPAVDLSGKNRDSIRTYLSKFKSKHIQEKKKGKRENK